MSLLHHVDLVDGIWIRHATESARRGGPPLPFVFGALRSELTHHRQRWGFPAAEKRIAVLALDPMNEAQGKYAYAMEREGFEVVRLDYRHCYVSRTTADSDLLGPAQQTVSHWITYMLGMLGARPFSTAVIFSGSFELAGPLEDYTSPARSGRAVLAYFRQFLDKRWFDIGLTGNRIGDVQFEDLDPKATALLGIDLAPPQSSKSLESSRRVPF